MKYKLKQGKSVEDMPVFSKLLKLIANSIKGSGKVELEVVPKAAKEFLEEVSSVKPKAKIKGEE